MVKTALVIWDWNGTLLDDTRQCYEIENAMRTRRGMPPFSGMEEYRWLFRFPVIEFYKDMGYTFETESYEAISEEFVRLYTEIVYDCPLQPGSRETLETLRCRGIPQALLSATSQARLEQQVRRFGLDHYFEAVLGQKDDLAHGKAERGRRYLESSGVDPAQVLFIGDTDHDYAVASAMGCRVALLSAGHQPRAVLERCGVPVIDSLAELPALV